MRRAPRHRGRARRSRSGARLREANERLARQSFQTVQSRVATVLGDLVRQVRAEQEADAADVLVVATQAEVAQLAGSSRESASRFLAVLERAGIVTQGRGRLDRPRPRRAAALCLLSDGGRRRRQRPGALREHSYGGVVVAGRRGRSDRPARQARARAPEGRPGAAARRRRRPPRARCARRPASTARSARRSATSPTATAARAGGSARPCRFFLLDYVEGSTDDHDHEVTEARWVPLEAARSSSPTRASATWSRARSACSTPSGSDRVRADVQALNFYSQIFADQMKRGRKTATIRLGDKRHKYRKNQVVMVTVGYQYSPREKVFNAVIDNVEVKKRLRALAARHRARQPGVPPGRRAHALHGADLRA